MTISHSYDIICLCFYSNLAHWLCWIIKKFQLVCSKCRLTRIKCLFALPLGVCLKYKVKLKKTKVPGRRTLSYRKRSKKIKARRFFIIFFNFETLFSNQNLISVQSIRLKFILKHLLRTKSNVKWMKSIEIGRMCLCNDHRIICISSFCLKS